MNGPDKQSGPAATPDRSPNDTDANTVASDNSESGELLDATGLPDAGEQ